MAANFAGVAGGGNDQRNDIVIRGNSPLGLLWRLEGADIPNPNHFGSQGANGGPVSIINTNMLSNSDFLTGAFPAEYGNAQAGVFDLKLRNGNNEKREFIGQVGFGGLELLAEGPIQKSKGSSFMMS
jgi:outer membrane receptor protein involved in Fe transport